MCDIKGNVDDLQNLYYLKVVKVKSDLPDIKTIKTIIFTKPGIVQIDGTEYFGSELLIAAFVDEVNATLFKMMEIKSPEEWLIDPRYKYYSDDYKLYLHKIWEHGF